MGRGDYLRRKENIMATKKAVEEATGEEKFLVILEPARDNEENFLIVGVNGVAYKLMRGVPLYVNKAVKEVLDNSKIAKKIVDENKSKAGKKLL